MTILKGRSIYPVVFEKMKDGYLVYVPDFDINTQGEDLGEAMAMARDAISVTGVSLAEDFGKELPVPSSIDDVRAAYAPNEVMMVDVDFEAYQRKYIQRTVRVNVSLPSWLNEAAKDAGINVSAVLQQALKEELDLDECKAEKIGG